MKATDPGFPADIPAWCERTGNRLIALKREGDVFVATVGKGQVSSDLRHDPAASAFLDKTIIVFSGDLDRAIAAFIFSSVKGVLEHGAAVSAYTAASNPLPLP